MPTHDTPAHATPTPPVTPAAPSRLTPPSTADLLASGLDAIVHGRRMPPPLQPATLALPRPATVAEGCLAILRLR